MPNALVLAPVRRVLIVTDRGPIGPTGAAGAVADAIVPFYLAAGTTFTVPEYRQGLFNVPVEVDGVLTVDGLLVEVD